MTPGRMAQIHASAFTEHRPWTKDEFETLIESEHVFVVSTDPSCFSLGRAVAGEAELLTIATQNDQKRQGLGFACLTAFLDECKTLGCDSVYLEVDAINAPAISLYEKKGFEINGARKNYYLLLSGQRSDALLMSLKLVG